MTIATITKTTEAIIIITTIIIIMIIILIIFVTVVIVITGRTEQNDLQYSEQCNYGTQKTAVKEQLLNCGEHAATNRIDSACAANKLTRQRLKPIQKFWQLHNVLDKTVQEIA